MGIGMERQLAIYMAGLAEQKPLQSTRVENLRQLARETLSAEAWGYLEGSAGSEDTALANLEAFRRWRIVPRMLCGVARPDPSVELFGRRLSAPILLAPIGVQSILHADAELAVARAAASVGLPMVLSTVSSRSLEEVAKVMGDAPRWFQLYWSASQDLTTSLIGRAEAAGFEALVGFARGIRGGYEGKRAGGKTACDVDSRFLFDNLGDMEKQNAIAALARPFSRPIVRPCPYQALLPE